MTRSFKTSHQPVFRPSLLAPAYWPTWLLFALIGLLWLLPTRARGWLASGCARLATTIPSKRRTIALTNLATCFPELDAAAIRRLLRRHARVQFEVYLTYGDLLFGSAQRLRGRFDVTGAEYAERAGAGGRGIMLLTPHCCAFEFAGQAVAIEHPIVSMARLHTDNDALDWLVNRMRVRFGGVVYGNRQSMVPLIRAVREGFWMFYLPDEDKGMSNGEFVPFFGTPKLTTATIGRLATACHAAVVPMMASYCPDRRRFGITFYPPLEDFPCGEPQRDAERMNATFERMIAADPAQYAWTQRIFRSRPEGEAPIYPDMARKKKQGKSGVGKSRSGDRSHS
jgi:Kdo2-lipid IVA lauroyltransferase/acyltransferase